MKKPDVPCRGCKERVAEPNCHPTCSRYQEFKRIKAEYNAIVGENKREYREQEDISYERLKRLRKRRRDGKSKDQYQE